MLLLNARSFQLFRSKHWDTSASDTEISRRPPIQKKIRETNALETAGKTYEKPYANPEKPEKPENLLCFLDFSEKCRKQRTYVLVIWLTYSSILHVMLTYITIVGISAKKIFFFFLQKIEVFDEGKEESSSFLVVIY